jgi:hypothetical protein
MQYPAMGKQHAAPDSIEFRVKMHFPPIAQALEGGARAAFSAAISFWNN